MYLCLTDDWEPLTIHRRVTVEHLERVWRCFVLGGGGRALSVGNDGFGALPPIQFSPHRSTLNLPCPVGRLKQVN